MIKGLYAAASAMIAGMERQTIISHNIANADTTGFKTVLLGLNDWIDTQVVTNSEQTQINPLLPSVYNTLLPDQLRYVGDLGLGVDTSAETIDFTQGALETTGETYDVAIEGDGFFHIQTTDGDRYTRDGRFLRDAEGNLVTVDGNKVLDQDGQPITLEEGDVGIGLDGMIYVDNEEVTKIGLFTFENPITDLTRDPSNMYIATGTALETGVGTIRQSTLEMSNVNISQMMTQMISVARNYEAAQKLVTVQDSLLGKTISTLGKV
jgi:flagellar basal-body rod protein FlgF